MIDANYPDVELISRLAAQVTNAAYERALHLGYERAILENESVVKYLKDFVMHQLIITLPIDKDTKSD